MMPAPMKSLLLQVGAALVLVFLFGPGRALAVSDEDRELARQHVQAVEQAELQAARDAEAKKARQQAAARKAREQAAARKAAKAAAAAQAQRESRQSAADRAGATARTAIRAKTEPPDASPPSSSPDQRVFRDRLKDGSPGPAMVRLTGGTFQMGSPEDEPGRSASEGPRHPVTVQPFAIGQTEATFADYDRFAHATGHEKPGDEGWGRGSHPVINVSWDDATAYAAWLAKQTGQPYRLPTEAEWEYAARAGTKTPFWTGRCINTDQANYDGNHPPSGCGSKTGVYREKTVPAGSLPPNPWGLHEVAGNVWEWVQDAAVHDNYDGAPADGSAWEGASGEGRVLRGGSWFNCGRRVRSAFRARDDPGARSHALGFRLVLGPQPRPGKAGR